MTEIPDNLDNLVECDDCHREVPQWAAELLKPPGGWLCPICFTRRVDKKYAKVLFEVTKILLPHLPGK